MQNAVPSLVAIAVLPTASTLVWSTAPSSPIHQKVAVLLVSCMQVPTFDSTALQGQGEVLPVVTLSSSCSKGTREVCPVASFVQLMQPPPSSLKEAFKILLEAGCSAMSGPSRVG